LSTVDRRPSAVDHTQRPALCTAQSRLGVTQLIARSVVVNQDFFSGKSISSSVDFNFQISQGGVATNFGWGGNLYDST